MKAWNLVETTPLNLLMTIGKLESFTRLNYLALCLLMVISLAPGKLIANSNPHPDDPIKSGEHEAALALVKTELVTHTAVKGGAWNNPQTWRNGRLPAEGSRVLIPHGIRVILTSKQSERIKTIRVDGMLRFASWNDTELRVNTMVISPDGRLEIGTKRNPIKR